MGEEENKEPAAEEKKTEEKKPDEEKPPKEGKDEAAKDSKAGDNPAPVEEKKKEESKGDGKDPKEEPSPPPPSPQVIELKVYMHCEGCARKVRRCLKGFDGVEEVTTECRTSKVIVKGDKADPLKVLERVQKKSHRQVELISPIPKPPPKEEEKKAAPEEKPPKPEPEKEPPPVVTVSLKVHMHCEACSMEIKKRILRMKGVESVEPNIKSSEVVVKGVFDPLALVDYVYRRTGKQAVIVKQDPEIKQEEKGKESKEEKKEEEEKPKKGDDVGESKEKKEAVEVGEPGEVFVGDESTVVELKKYEHYYSSPLELYSPYPYPPQIFSDENPNACTVM